MGGVRAAVRRIISCFLTWGLILTALTCLHARVAHAAAGDLDPSFDGDGKALPAITGASYISVQAVAEQSDGKIVGLAQYVHSGSGDQDFVLFRLLPDGALDTGFGSAGWVITDFGACDWPKDVAIDGNGKIMAVGVMEPGCGSDANYQGLIARYETNGILDNTFGTNGKHIMADMWVTGWNAVAVQSDGKIVVAGHFSNVFCVARFTTAGVGDTTFNGSGVRTMDLTPSTRSAAADVAIDGSGRIVAVGTAYYSGEDANAVVARFTTGGALDTAFNSDGYWAMDLFSSSDDHAVGVALDTQDGAYMACHATGGGYGSDGTAVVVRLTAGGALDYNFSGTGKSSLTVPGENMYTRGIALDPWGKPLLGGYFGSSSGPFGGDSWLIRFHTNGEPDFYFGGDGLLWIRNGATCSLSGGVHAASQGRALCAGSTEGDPLVTRHRLSSLPTSGCLEMLLTR